VTRLTACSDADAVADRAAAVIERSLHRAVHERGRAHLALSGGTTPGSTYERIGRRRGALDGVQVWFADERCVPPQDAESNYRMAAETMLDPASVPEQNVHRMPGELGPQEGASSYARELLEGVPADGAPVPVLDLIVLGIGPDGHVASLFPGAPALDAPEHDVCLGVERSPKPPPERITLSLGMLRAARSCVLLATGAGKADAVAAMLGRPSKHVPASLLRRERLTVIVDDAAAPPR
jgi:6-phosphogluconolactonase